MLVASKGPRSVGRPPDAELQERRRAGILAAATAVFSRRGFAGADVQEIADKTGVGKGTVYRYFPSKEELFLAAVDHEMLRLSEYIHQFAQSAETDIQRLEHGMKGYLAFFDENPDVIELVILERAHFRDRKQATYFAHRDASLDPWKELFRRLIAAGTIRDVPVSRVVDVISDLLYGTIFTNHFAGRRKLLRNQCEDVLDILFRGLLAGKEQPQ
jgi:AcrR family transcriptional regulator